MAVLTSKAQNLAQFTLTLTGASFGPVSGIFFLGLLFPRTNVKGAWVGLGTAYVSIEISVYEY